MTQSKFEQANSEILAVWIAAGKDIPAFDSDTGRAISIAQSIIDENHSIDEPDDIYELLQQQDFFEKYYVDDGRGSPASSPYIVMFYDGEKKLYQETCGSIAINYEWVKTVEKVFADFAPEVLEEYQEEIEANYYDLFDFIETIESKLGEDDFYVEYDGNEYRFISDGSLWDTYVEEIQNTVEDCYDLNLDKIPHFVEFSIDWEQTAKNCLVDGYAHQFSSYDGDFHVECEDYNIFRTN